MGAECGSQETVSAMVQSAREINESGPDVVIYGMVPSSLVSRPAACEGWLHAESADRQRSRRCPLWQAGGRD